MNRVKYRPVGKSGPVVVVKISQRKRAVQGTFTRSGHFIPSRQITVKNANSNMDRNGYVRAGVRHG